LIHALAAERRRARRRFGARTNDAVGCYGYPSFGTSPATGWSCADDINVAEARHGSTPSRPVQRDQQVCNCGLNEINRLGTGGHVCKSPDRLGSFNVSVVNASR
jgi:hypothetical protein